MDRPRGRLPSGSLLVNRPIWVRQRQLLQQPPQPHPPTLHAPHPLVAHQSYPPDERHIEELQVPPPRLQSQVRHAYALVGSDICPDAIAIRARVTVRSTTPQVPREPLLFFMLSLIFLTFLSYVHCGRMAFSVKVVVGGQTSDRRRTNRQRRAPPTVHPVPRNSRSLYSRRKGTPREISRFRMVERRAGVSPVVVDWQRAAS